jgi:hypothetical protein
VQLEPSLAALALLAVAGLLILYKLTELLLRVLTISTVSAGFYLILTQITELPLSAANLVRFAVGGTVLYFVLDFADSVYSAAASLWAVPATAASLLSERIKPGSALRRIRQWRARRQMESEDAGAQEDPDSERVKEVVIDRVKSDEKDDQS